MKGFRDCIQFYTYQPGCMEPDPKRVEGNEKVPMTLTGLEQVFSTLCHTCSQPNAAEFLVDLDDQVNKCGVLTANNRSAICTHSDLL